MAASDVGTQATALNHAESVSIAVRLRSGGDILVNADQEGITAALPDHPLNGEAADALLASLRLADDATRVARTQHALSGAKLRTVQLPADADQGGAA